MYLAAVVLLVSRRVLLGLLYAAPAAAAFRSPGATPALTTSGAVILAGLIWGLYNTGFAMIFSFGPSMLAERGLPLTAAGSITSIVLWLALVSVPLGGFLADRTKRPYAILVAGCLASALLLLLATRVEPIPVFIVIGIISRPAGGCDHEPAGSRPGGRDARDRDGALLHVFYFAVGVGPSIGGWIAAQAGNAATFDFGAAMLAACPLAALAVPPPGAAAMRDRESSAPRGRA